VRAVWVSTYSGVANDNPNSATRLVRYAAASIAKHIHYHASNQCAAEPGQSLVPYVKVDVSIIAGTTPENF
jgi:hypothetical protein